uniref:Metaxin-1-like n=1 Tax=Ciona intestinalis TaxID=7719 RepID=A0A1W2WJD9_CIOIN|nr:metaxin-1-like [Ciona intestinalis]|eukprot:XP_002128675.1 metaxin-1-like [Ciona intestinalis]
MSSPKKSTDGKMEVKCWGEGWGLPSLDPDCLSVIAYANLAKAPIEVVPALPKDTITGSLPELQIDEFIYPRAFTIIGIFRREGYNADYSLSQSENADTLAFLSYIEQKLKPAILYSLWIDVRNFNKVTRPAYGKACGFPWSLWYPSRLVKSYTNQLWLSKGGESFTCIKEVEKVIYKDAHDCLNVLESRMSSTDYFFGDFPTTIDAVLYGHLAVLLHAPLVSTELQNHLNSCDKLRAFCARMSLFCPSSSSLPTQVKSNSEDQIINRDKIISIAVAVTAMLVYALTSGVLTARRSKLATKLKQLNEFDEFEQMD